eukprot:SAG31_NODE_5889_length_2272_cov_1.308790_3_plen_133_part_00
MTCADSCARHVRDRSSSIVRKFSTRSFCVLQTSATILGHISQLSQRFRAEIDAVYVLQAGFVGCWVRAATTNGIFAGSLAADEWLSGCVLVFPTTAEQGEWHGVRLMGDPFVYPVRSQVQQILHAELTELLP